MCKCTPEIRTPWCGGPGCEEPAQVLITVSHPSHYNSGKIEVIEAIEDWKLGFHRGNAVKYIARAGRKDPAREIEDLEKARWYLAREIELIRSRAAGEEPVRPNDMVPLREEEEHA